ncbi:MAG TPA: NAD(P)/FAD-dependent oxidoreductase [Bacteroidota bacterium]|nr:NAD(P)/FAD-dependent oxidoreductase [Bacteroidota bacterium]
MTSADVIVLGAGAAGLMCAVAAAGRGRRVVVLERNDRIGEKIRISGGGRCNFTNTVTQAEHYLSDNPHFAKSALARFTPDDFIRMVEKHGIRYHEKTRGQLFCDRSSLEIIALLEKECGSAGVKIVTGCNVSDVREVTRDGRFCALTGGGEFTADALVVATGGLSIPKLGATDLGYRIAEQFGLRINDPRPGLVPLTLAGEDLEFASGLSGVSIDAAVTCGRTTFRENILFTHRGLSGPAILQISSYWRPGTSVTLDLSPGSDVGKILAGRRGERTELSTVLSEILPKRFVKAWCGRFAASRPMSGHSNGELKRIASGLHSWTIVPAGTEGFAKAEVTCGGIDTGELSSKTMESKKVPGLCFIGEVVDVTGHLGGYNFQWAWASGYVAGLYA